MLHSGHIAFFEEAASHGDVYVGIGSDATINKLKDRKTLYTEDERLYMIRALRYVKDAWINRGSGTIDFMEEIKKLQPDILFVNEDGDAKVKHDLCKQLGIEMVVSKRIPRENLPSRSTTDLRKKSIVPYRLDLAGGWLDQPFVSEHHPGSVITICIEPGHEFNDRSGMASSTRKKAIEIWGYSLPDDDPEKIAKVLFSFENPPGKEEISGSQDSIGIVFPGLNKLDYEGKYWPEKITSVLYEDTLCWIENHLWFVQLGPRNSGYDVLADTNIDKANASALADATEATWQAIMEKDVKAFGRGMRESLEAQVRMFPHMLNPQVQHVIDKHKNQALGYKLSGAGGGGYLVVVSATPIEDAVQVRIKR